MSYNNFINALMIFITQLILGTYVMMLTEFRKPVKKWRILWFIIIILVVSANVLMILFFGAWDTYKRVGVFTMTLPYVLVTLWCSESKGLRVVFNICTCIWLGCIGNANGILAHAFIPDNVWISLLCRTISYFILYFVVRAIKPYYKQMIKVLDGVWGLLCLIPTITFLSTLYMINNLLPQNPIPISIVIYSITAVCSCSYFLIYLFFIRVQKEEELKTSRYLMNTQIYAMEKQIELIKESEEKMRIERHDMRHKWIIISDLAEQGDKKAIFDFIELEQRQLNKTTVKHWCSNATLNAVFNYYFSWAEREGIELDEKLVISGALDISNIELSMVFGNALENAINACKDLPKEKRKIICKCMDNPSLMISIENPYTGDMDFDCNGLPVNFEEGHGIGIHSIIEICKKYNAVWSINTENKWFKLRISL